MIHAFFTAPAFLLLLPVVLYALLLLFFLYGWHRTPVFDEGCAAPRERVSIVVPCRNEEAHLPALLAALRRQTWPAELTEILFVDDHSADATWSLLGRAAAEDGRLRVLRNGGHGKKEALLTGARAARGTFLLTTDADALPPPSWVAVLMAWRRRTGAAFVAAPVLPQQRPGVVGLFRTAESAVLALIAAGAATLGHPLFCSGANMAFSGELLRLEDDPLRRDVASGEDVFLLHTVKAHRPAAISFLRSRRATVTVREPAGLRALLRQRRRWAGKTPRYRDGDTLATALLVLLANLVPLAALILTFRDPALWPLPVTLLLVKTLPELGLLISALTFFGRKKILLYVPFLQLLYPLYVVIVLMLTVTTPASSRGHWDRRKGT